MRYGLGGPVMSTRSTVEGFGGFRVGGFGGFGVESP